MTATNTPTVLATLLQHLHSNMSAIFKLVLASSCSLTKSTFSSLGEHTAHATGGWSSTLGNGADLFVPFGKHYVGVIEAIMQAGIVQESTASLRVRLVIDAGVAHMLAVGAHLCYFNTPFKTEARRSLISIASRCETEQPQLIAGMMAARAALHDIDSDEDCINKQAGGLLKEPMNFADDMTTTDATQDQDGRRGRHLQEVCYICCCYTCTQWDKTRGKTLSSSNLCMYTLITLQN